MQRFVMDERMVSSVREKLLELFNEHGREAMWEQLERYCQEILKSAAAKTNERDLTQRLFEVESAELNEVIVELRLSTSGLNFMTRIFCRKSFA